EATYGGEDAARPYVTARVAGWPTRLLVDRTTLPTTDREFVARLAADTWHGVDAFVDREHRLPVDNVRLGGTSAARADARVGDYTNITSVGLHLLAVVAARELGLVSGADAVARIRAVLDT